MGLGGNLQIVWVGIALFTEDFHANTVESFHPGSGLDNKTTAKNAKSQSKLAQYKVHQVR